MALPASLRPGATGSNDHFAEHCRDELCHRLPCRLWKDGYRAGYSAGFAAGMASAGNG